MSVIRRAWLWRRLDKRDRWGVLLDRPDGAMTANPDVWEVVEVVPADQLREENDRLRSTIEQLTMDRDSWKVLAGELTEQRDELRREFEGRLVCEELEWGLHEQDWDGCVW